MSEPERPPGSQEIPNAPPESVIPYRAAEDDLPERASRARQVIAGIVLSTAAVLGLVALWIMANLRLGPGPYTFEWQGPSVVTACVIGALAVVTWVGRTQFGKRWFAMGVLIGVGVGALIEGACFLLSK